MNRSLTEEANEPRTLSPSEWTRAALLFPGTARALVGGPLLRIPPPDGPSLLESVAILDRCYPRWGNDFARVASLVRPRLRHRGLADVPHVAPANEGNTCRQGLVGVHRTLHSQRRRSDSFRRPLQPWPEVAVLGLFLERPPAPAFRVDPLAPPVHSLELAFPSSRRRVRTSCVRPRHHRAFYHPRLYGHCDGTGCFWFRNSRRRVARLGQPSSPHVV